jgi:hypothetical protein
MHTKSSRIYCNPIYCIFKVLIYLNNVELYKESRIYEFDSECWNPYKNDLYCLGIVMM